MKEIWRPVKGYEGFYDASNMGRIRSVTRYVRRSRGGQQILRGRILRPHLNPKKYFTVAISKDGISRTNYVHKLVLNAFSVRPIWAEEINHINHRSRDNRLINLEWCTMQYNRDYSYRDGNHSKARPVIRISDGKIYRSMNQAAIQNGTHDSQIEKVCSGKMKQTHGMKFEFIKT